MRTLALLPWICATALAQAPDFQKDVLPILEARCVECHKAPYKDQAGVLKNPKGGLRLDGRGFVEKGGKNGRVLAPGKPEQSALYARTVLPEDDADHMPDDGEPLTKEQTETLKRWIAAGAEFGGWTGAGGPSTTDQRLEVATPDPLLTRLQAGLTPVADATLQKLASKFARIVPLATGSPLLRVEFLGHDPQVGDREVDALAPIMDHVVELCLARTKVTDKSLDSIAKMPRLVRLDLRETQVSEVGVERLANLPELRTLNLFATRVGDGLSEALANAKSLETLYVWQSKVTNEGLVKLRASLPKTKIVGAPELATEKLESGKGRRGKK